MPSRIFGNRPLGPAVGIFVAVDPLSRDFTLSRIAPLDATAVPPRFLSPDGLPAGLHIDAFWYELLQEGNPIFRASAPDPLEQAAESIFEDGFARTERAQAPSTVRVVVPKSAADVADTLQFYSSALALAWDRPLHRPIGIISLPRT